MPDAPAQDRTPRHPGWTIAASMLASSLAFIDGSVTNVALPAIGHALQASAGDFPWIINAYLLPLAALLLLGGAIGDHYGRRRVMVTGIAIFLIGSIGCALATGLATLLGARTVQGIGAAILMPNSLGILGSTFSGEARGRAIGTWASAGAISSAVGPPLGGWLVDTAGWRAIFYLNVPVAIGAMIVALRYVDDGTEGDGALDWRGAGLATLALAVLTWALTQWSAHHAASLRTWIALGAGTALFAAFLLVEGRLREAAMMPLSLFASRPFVGLTLLTFLLYGSLGGLLVLLPYVLIVGAGYSPVQAGLALLPFSIVIGVTSRLAGWLAARIGPRWPLTVGPIVTGLGFALMGRLDPQAGYWTGVLPAVLVVACGMAGAVAPLTTAVLSTVDDRHSGTASGFNSAVSRTGGLVATALAGGVIAETGADLIGAFHVAAIVGAVLSVAAGIAAWAMLDR